MGFIRFILEIILAFILPPLGVLLHTGLCNFTLLLNILLTILGWLPGMRDLNVVHILTR